MNKARKWLIKKLAGDTLVILNAAIIYKHHPIFADPKDDLLLDKNIIAHAENATAAQIFAANVFDNTDTSQIKLKPEYEKPYLEVVKSINDTIKETESIEKSIGKQDA